MTHAQTHELTTLDAIREAAERLRGVALRTPLLPFRDGHFLKPESLQPTGSFKIRGAYNALARLSDADRARGVVTHSSGNHAQAIARAAQLLGTRALVVMPNNAPAVKVAGVRADGAEIEFVGPHNEERVARAHAIADSDGMVLVPSANHIDVITGQGTIGLEIVDQLAEAGIANETLTVLAPIGLGGLGAGVATAVKSLVPAATVIGVEPSLAADTRASLAAGEPTPWPSEQTSQTIADGLRGEAPADLPFAHLKRWLAGVIVVEEEEIRAAMRVATSEAHLVLEPSGAATLAALLFHADELSSRVVVAVLSGGNVDQDRFIELIRP